MKFVRQKCLFLLITFTFLTLFTVTSVHAMKIYVVTSSGKTLTLEAKPEDTILELKDFVFDVTQIHQATQRMYKGSAELGDKQTLKSNNISEGDTIYVKMGAGVMEKKEGMGGFIKTLIYLAVIAVVVLIFKKLLTRKDIEEENIET